ncbi:hypothetical protein TNCT_732351 [Trichonephila clavata]|uniref:Uncharacterized protein n=1 Tax=Trichonephila clavata TaxID=2740835 RepID=A0A8X6HVL6_TRICU|nr:hypothetical protein TNCT_732351 [Trichonephila clavata]
MFRANRSSTETVELYHTFGELVSLSDPAQGEGGVRWERPEVPVVTDVSSLSLELSVRHQSLAALPEPSLPDPRGRTVNDRCSLQKPGEEDFFSLSSPCCFLSSCPGSTLRNFRLASLFARFLRDFSFVWIEINPSSALAKF